MLFMSIPRDKTCCQSVLIGGRGITKVFQYNKVVHTIQLGFLDLEFTRLQTVAQGRCG